MCTPVHLHSQDSEHAQARDPQNFFLFLPWILSLPFFPTCHPGIADFFSQLISFPFCKIFIWMESYSMHSLGVGREIWFLSLSMIIDSWILLHTLFVHSFPLTIIIWIYHNFLILSPVSAYLDYFSWRLLQIKQLWTFMYRSLYGVYVNFSWV